MNKVKLLLYSKEYNLPVKLIQKFQINILDNNNYGYLTKNNFLKCVSVIFFYQVTKGIKYVPLGRSYWKQLFGGNYHVNVIKPLIAFGIIECRDFGYRTFPNYESESSKGKQAGLVGIRYCINPVLLSDEFDLIHYLKDSKAITPQVQISNKAIGFNPISKLNIDYVIQINQVKTNEWIIANAERLCKEFMHPEYVTPDIDELTIEYHEYLDEDSFNTRYATVKSVRLLAQTYNKEFFYFKDKFYIANTEEFMKNRIASLIYYYKWAVSRLISVPIIDIRSTVNLRVHNNLVNFPSKILQFVTINNQYIVQLDLRTSQFLIFANLLNAYIQDGDKELMKFFKNPVTRKYLRRLFNVLNEYKNKLPAAGVDINNYESGKSSNYDVIKFIRDVFFQDFYAVVQQELGLHERGFAKQMIFKLLFKKSNKSDRLLDKLSKRYPVVMAIMSGFKKVDTLAESHQDEVIPESKQEEEITESDYNINGDQNNNFSVFLQCVESEIFIDNILIPLRQQGIPCFTRHDSICVASGYEDQVEAFVKDVFVKIGFKYNHKVEDKFWEVVDDDELEDSGYLDWLSDENELKSDYHIDEKL